MRLGIIAAASATGTSEPVLGERDAQLVRDRLALEDMGFVVHDIDSSRDMAEQVDAVLAEHVGQLDEVLVYVSALTVTLDNGECFFCLDAANPDVGDSVRDVVAALAEHHENRTLVVVEGRHEASDVEGLRAAANALRDAIDSPSTGIEAIVSMRSLGAHHERIPSRFTVGLLEEVDDWVGGLVAKQVYAAILQSADLGTWPHAELYASGRQSLSLRNPSLYPIAAGPSLGPARTAAARSAPTPSSAGAEPPPPPKRAAKPAPEVPAEEPPPPPKRAAKPAPEVPAEEPPPPPKRAAKPAPEVPAEPAMNLFPPPMPVPDLTGPAEPARGKKGGPRREAPPSERVDAATVTLGDKRKPGAQAPVDTGLPKVVISPKVDPRRRPTMRRIDLDVKALVAQEPEALEAALANAMTSMNDEQASEEEPSDAASEVEAPRDAAPSGEDHAAESVASPPDEPPPPPKRAAKPVPAAPAEELPPPPKRERMAASLDLEDEGWTVPTRGATESKPKAEPLVAAKAAPKSDPPPGPTPDAVPPERPSIARLPKKVTDWTVDEHIAAGDEHFASGDLEQSLAEFKKALGKLGTSSSPARAELYVRVGEVNRAQGNSRLAMSNFEKALAIVPTLARAIEGVLACHLDQRNWRAVLTAEDKLLAALPSDEPERLERLLEFGDRALANDNASQARTRYLEARDSFPEDPRALERLLELAGDAELTDELLDVRRRLLAFIGDPTERAQATVELGRLCLDSGDREEEALRLFEGALDVDPGQLDALEALAAVLAENQEWAELERIYRKSIAAFADYVDAEGSPEHAILAELQRKLALLFRDHLEDPEQALEALDAELELRPDDLGARLLAAELAIELETPAKALDHLRHATILEPLRTDTYRQLHALGARFDEPETGFLAASVLQALAASDEDALASYEEHRVQGVPTLRRALRPEAWAWLRGKEHDPLLDRVMRALAPSVLRARILQLEEKKKLPALPERQDPKTSTASVVRSIGWAGQFLGIEPPAIYLDDKVDTPMSARFARHQAMVVGKGAMRGRSVAELAFFAGRHLALRLPEHELVSHMASIDELSACFMAGLKITLGAAPSGPLAPIVDVLAQALAPQVTAEERAELERTVKALMGRKSTLDLTSWVGGVERCATRAGYLLCGDLGLAVKILEAEGDTAFSTAQSRVADLCAFAVSGAHMKLRQELGSSLIVSAELPRLTTPPLGA